jgi:hypothetical protein
MERDGANTYWVRRPCIFTSVDEQNVTTQMQRIADVDVHHTGDATPCRC